MRTSAPFSVDLMVSTSTLSVIETEIETISAEALPAASITTPRPDVIEEDGTRGGNVVPGLAI